MQLIIHATDLMLVGLISVVKDAPGVKLAAIDGLSPNDARPHGHNVDLGRAIASHVIADL